MLTQWGRAADVPAAAGAGALVPVQRNQRQVVEERDAIRNEVVQHCEEKMRQDERQAADRRSSRGEGEAPYYIYPHAERSFGSLLEHRLIRSFPASIIAGMGQMQCTTYRGLWPEIHRAWFAVDNQLFVWDYTTSETVAVIDDLDQLIVAVGLCKPNPDVFKEHVKYVVVVCTTTAIYLFAAQFSDQTPEGSLSLRRTNFSVSTDGVIVKKVVGTVSGRIFLAGADGCLYEIHYENEGDSILQALRVANRCRKLNHTSWPISTLPVISMLQKVAGHDMSSLIDVAVDDARGLLYTLSERGVVQLYDLGLQGDQTIMQRQRETIFRKAEHWCLREGKINIFREGEHRYRIISIHVVPPTENADTHAVAISNAGFRFFLRTNVHVSDRGDRKGPTALEISEIRFPPKSDIWDALRAPDLGANRIAFQPDSSQSTPIGYTRAYYSRGLMLLVDQRDGALGDRAIGFMDEGSAGRGGEVVAEVQLRQGPDEAGPLPLPGSGKIHDVGEESYILFPIEERERRTDTLRYLQATSASPDSDESPGGDGAAGPRGTRSRQNPQNTFAAEFRVMYEESRGPYVTHMFRRFGATLSENAEQLTSSRILVILTSQALHVVAKVRPVDLLARILHDRSAQHSSSGLIHEFRNIFGMEETCALFCSVAARVPADLGYPVGRGLLAEPHPVQTMAAAVNYLRVWYSKDGAQANTQTHYGQLQLGYQYYGLLLAFSRLVRPVWFKPLVYDEGVPVVPVATLFLQSPELRAIIEPLERLREVMAQLYPRAVRIAAVDVLARAGEPGEDGHLARMQALYFIMDRSLQALRFLERLAAFWRRSSRVRLPLAALRDMAFVDLVTCPDAHDRVKSTMRELLQPAGAVENAAVEDLTRDLSSGSFSYFSRGDQLTYEARMQVREGLQYGLGSNERVSMACQAAENLVRAAVYWRTPADVDALDGGSAAGTIAAHAQEVLNDGLALQLLKLAPTQPQVGAAVVEMTLMAAQNFGAPPFRASSLSRQRRLSAPLSSESERVALDESDPLRTLSDQERDELRRRCYVCLRDAIFWLMNPRIWDAKLPGYLPKDERECGAWKMIKSALETEDTDFHNIMYQSLLQEMKAQRGDFIYRDMLFSIQKPQLERFLYEQPENRVDNLRYYYMHQKRYSSALQLLEQSAQSKTERLSLEKRLEYLRDALSCAQHCRTTGDVTVTAPRIQSIQDQLDVAMLQLKVFSRLRDQVARCAHAEPDDTNNIMQLEQGLVGVDAIYTLVVRYTLWEEGLELINMCDVDNQAASQAVKDFWVNIIYNELPERANNARLRKWLKDRTATVTSRWWSAGRGRKGEHAGLPDGGALDEPSDDAMYNLMATIRRIAQVLGVGRGGADVGGGAHMHSRAFPLNFLCNELEQLETEVDLALGLQTYRVGNTRPMPHRTWRELRALGLPFMDLFKAYWEIYVRLAQDTQPELRMHALDTLRSITEAWYAALLENVGVGASVMLDNRQRAFVVSSLRKLAPHQSAGSEGYDAIVTSLIHLQNCFHQYPERVD